MLLLLLLLRCSSNNITIFKSFRICNFPLLIYWSETDFFSGASFTSASSSIFFSFFFYFFFLPFPRRCTICCALPRNVCFCARTNAYAFKLHHLWNVWVFFFSFFLFVFACYLPVNNGADDTLPFPSLLLCLRHCCWLCERVRVWRNDGIITLWLIRLCRFDSQREYTEIALMQDASLGVDIVAKATAM